MLYDLFVKWHHKLGNQLYACCPMHMEKTPSFTVNEDTGEWFCHGEQKGGTEVEFLMEYYDVPREVAKYALETWEKKGTLPFPTHADVEALHAELLRRPSEVAELHSYGISDDIIEQFKLGFEDLRITVPVYGYSGHLVNIRKYLPPHRRKSGGNTAKCMNIRGLGSNRFLPYEAFKKDTIYIVEGEKDMLVARSQGFNAVTGTSGSAIPTDELALFKGKHVVLMLDTDAVGRRNTDKYLKLLKPIAAEIDIVTLPEKDFTDYWIKFQNPDISQFTRPAEISRTEKVQVEAQETTLVHSEFNDNLNTWMKLKNMSVVGVESKIYTVPTRLRAVCRNTRCTRPCPLAQADSELTTFDIDPRQMLQFVDASDNAQDIFVRKLFGCKSVQAEPLDFINVQKLIFQEGASFVDGLEEASFETRYGIYMYTDYRLSATLKYDFEACRVTDPRSQQNYYVIRSAESVSSVQPSTDPSVVEHFRSVATGCTSAAELIQKHYDEWMPALGIEGRPDLFGALMLTYCSVTEIPWQAGIVKGWLDTMVIGDTRTGKSQMAQRLVKQLHMGAYINGENARSTGVIGGVQRFGDSWVVTWGAIPMNDRGLLIIDEASGLEVDDIKNLSSTRSSGAVTLNKIVKGEARARTRLIWLSNPRSGRNLSDFYWKGYGAFQEFIPVAEDQARYDLVLTAAREDVDVLQGIDSESTPNVSLWRGLFAEAWTLTAEQVHFPGDFRNKVRDVAHKLNEDFGGGPLVVGVAVHEKILRLACAFAVLCGDIYDGILAVSDKHLQFANEFLRTTLDKESLSYGAYIREFKRAQSKRKENVQYIRTLVAANPALKVLLSSNGFKGYQVQEILGMDRNESSKIMSDLITRGLLRPTSGATYVPDKMLIEIAKQMEV